MTNSDNTTVETRSVVTFHTAPEVKKRLDVLAKATNRSRSFLTNEAVLRYLSEEEDFIRDVKAGLAEAEAGLLIPHADAVKYFRSLGTDKPLPMPVPHKV